jgi:hypothetical protein
MEDDAANKDECSGLQRPAKSAFFQARHDQARRQFDTLFFVR